MSEDVIWSGSDLPYACLIDPERTNTFKRAIESTVKKGAVVIDIGAGTGILSFFAATAGAKKVIALEIDHFLAEKLRESIHNNSFDDVIEVVEGDAMLVDLPKNPDVITVELMETALMEEMQVVVMNHLHNKKIIGPKTQVIPCEYKTNIELVQYKNEFYGYRVNAPAHNWPNYSSKGEGWVQIDLRSVSDPVEVNSVNFQKGIIDRCVEETIQVEVRDNPANAVRISGEAKLTRGVNLGATNTINGDKILMLEKEITPGSHSLRVAYRLGGGLESLSIEEV